MSKQSAPLMKTPIKSCGEIPRFSPRIVILVPGVPSRGDTPETEGVGAILFNSSEILV